MPSKLLSLTVISVLFSPLGQAAVITSTGGELEAQGNRVAVPAGYGQYNAYGETLEWMFDGLTNPPKLGVAGAAELVFDIAPGAINLLGRTEAHNYELPESPYLGSRGSGAGSATLGFDLDSGGNFLFGWQADQRVDYSTNATLSRAGQALVECYGYLCRNNVDFSYFTTDGLMWLNPGHYELQFQMRSFGGDLVYGSDASLSLVSTVPLPAGLWLLLSGLGGLIGVARRRPDQH